MCVLSSDQRSSQYQRLGPVGYVMVKMVIHKRSLYKAFQLDDDWLPLSRFSLSFAVLRYFEGDSP